MVVKQVDKTHLQPYHEKGGSLLVPPFALCQLKIMNSEGFSVGDVVIKPSGKKPFTLTYVPTSPTRWDQYKGRYLDSNLSVTARKVVLYDKEVESEIPKTVYSFNDEYGTPILGTHVGTNSQGLLILEIEGKDDYVIKSPNELEEVLPYTFSVEIAGKEIHFIGTPDKVKKGDFLLQKSAPNGSFQIAQVKAVDTKNKGARSKFRRLKLVTEEV